MILPTAYLPCAGYIRALLANTVTIEVMESFEKQTFRNRSIIRDRHGNNVILTVPVCRVEHKQLTRDVQISYQSRWQHQHWMALRSCYEHTPFFEYYADALRPYYEQQVKYLIDLNDGLTSTIVCLMRNQNPLYTPLTTLNHSKNWHGECWTDRHTWQHENSITGILFEYGPETEMRITHA